MEKIAEQTEGLPCGGNLSLNSRLLARRFSRCAVLAHQLIKSPASVISRCNVSQRSLISVVSWKYFFGQEARSFWGADVNVVASPDTASDMTLALYRIFFRWYASYHDEGSHPHVHMVCYSADRHPGFLDKEGIAWIKFGLAKNIFRQELTEIYR